MLHGQRLYKRNLSLHLYMFSHCRDFNIFSSHGLLPSDLVAQSVERRRSNPKVVGSIPTLVRVFLCPCVGPFPSVGLTLAWFVWERNLALHITLYSVNYWCFCHLGKATLWTETQPLQVKWYCDVQMLDVAKNDKSPTPYPPKVARPSFLNGIPYTINLLINSQIFNVQ